MTVPFATLCALVGLFLVPLESSMAFSVAHKSQAVAKDPSIQVRQHQYSSSTLYYRDEDGNEESPESSASSICKDQLLHLLNQVPSNAPTSRRLTRDILNKVEELETLCPTPEDEVLGKLGGNWELQWTAQVSCSSD